MHRLLTLRGVCVRTLLRGNEAVASGCIRNQLVADDLERRSGEDATLWRVDGTTGVAQNVAASRLDELEVGRDVPDETFMCTVEFINTNISVLK